MLKGYQRGQKPVILTGSDHSHSFIVTDKPHLVSLRTCRKMSKNMCACCSWKIRAGRSRILCSPQPPDWTPASERSYYSRTKDKVGKKSDLQATEHSPFARSRAIRSSRTLPLGASTARKVPRPRVADSKLGNSFSRLRSPL